LSKKNPAFFSLIFVFTSLACLFPLSLYSSFFKIKFVILYCLILAAYAYLVYIRHRNFSDQLNLRRQGIEEELNVSGRDSLHLRELHSALEKKITNYESLKDFTGVLNNETALENISDMVVSRTFDLFGGKGNVLLFLFGEKTRKLELRAIKKEHPGEKIKEKAGDLFDQWALRHNQPLLVEDTTSDFRFDPDRVRQELSRTVGSLVCVPLITETNVLGVLRVDSPLQEAYSSDDLRFLSCIGDVAKLSLENAIYFGHMQELSVTDGLTGIFLRRYCLERLKEEFLRAERTNTPLSFLMLDLDHFKEMNDTHGHLAGDSILKKIAKSLKDFFDLPGNIVSRYGGEEFCVVLPYANKQEALRLAQSFRASMAEKEIAIRRQKVKVTVSIGVASYPDDVLIFEDLIRRSDEALLQAKRGGRNRVCSF